VLCHFLFRGQLLRKDWTLHSPLVLWVFFRSGAPSRGYDLAVQVLNRNPLTETQKQVNVVDWMKSKSTVRVCESCTI
jgi:hypothetical protein